VTYLKTLRWVIEGRVVNSVDVDSGLNANCEAESAKAGSDAVPMRTKALMEEASKKLEA